MNKPSAEGVMLTVFVLSPFGSRGSIGQVMWWKAWNFHKEEGSSRFGNAVEQTGRHGNQTIRVNGPQ